MQSKTKESEKTEEREMKKIFEKIKERILKGKAIRESFEDVHTRRH